MPRNLIAPKVMEGIIQDAAISPKGQKGVIQKIAADWGVTEAAVSQALQRHKPRVMELREAHSERSFELAIQIQDHMALKMADPGAIAETSLKDLAQALEKTTNAGVTAAEGHQRIVPIDISAVRGAMDALAMHDAAAKARKVGETKL